MFTNEEYNEKNYSDLIVLDDIFAILYQHTTRSSGGIERYSHFYTGRLKETPYLVISNFKQLEDRSQYLAISVLELDDEISIFEDLIKNMAIRLDPIFDTLQKAKNTKQISLISNITSKLESEIKFTLFQVQRLSRLDKLQKSALIFISKERLKILNKLRETPISKSEMRLILEKDVKNPNIDILLEPFLQLNLIRHDWIKGERDKKTGRMVKRGEYLFLIKDILFARVPNQNLLNHLKEIKHDLYSNYEQKVVEYFSNYNPNAQSIEETMTLAGFLLNPDIYDFFVLLKSKFYPIDKIPQIFSEFADMAEIIENMKNYNLITEIKDSKKRKWIFLLCDLKPLITYPLYLLPRIKKAYKSKDKEGELTYEIAKKALDLLEVTYSEKIDF